MKKIFLTGIGLLFAATLTFAQSANPEDKAKEKVAKLNEKLTLTEEQQSSIYDIVLEHAKAKQNTTQSPDEMKSMQEAKDAQIKDKLTDEQKALYDQMVAERAQKETTSPSTSTTPMTPANPTTPVTPPAQPEESTTTPQTPMQPAQPNGQ